MHPSSARQKEMGAPGRWDVAYVLNDKLGGVATFYANIIGHRPPDAPRQRAILLRSLLDRDARLTFELPADETHVVEYRLPRENVYAALRRLRRQIPAGPGAVVCNDWLELAALGAYPCERAVFHVVHDEYYVGLAERHADSIDVFITHSVYFRDRMKALLPHRSDRVFHLPYGVNLAPRVRHAAAGPLRLLFIGRLTESKGVFDLPLIDKQLRSQGVAVTWTVVGDGPLASEIKARWSDGGRVRYLAPRENAEVLALCETHDVFVLPTRFEGFPVSLLEAMSGGLVPVVSDLPSGVPEVVGPMTGFRVPIGDCTGFAAAVAAIDRDRDRLEVLSRECRRTVEQRFDIRERAGAYHDLFGRWEDLRRPRLAGSPLHYGSRLDRPWLPNWVVRGLRTAARFRHRGTRAA